MALALLISMSAASLPAAGPPPISGPHGTVRIHELLSVNSGGLLDEDGDDSDWIELLNESGASLDLGGWHLTDDAGDLSKWTLPSTVVPHGGYLVVFASDKDRAVSGSELHTNFKLSSSGEYLALVLPDGVTVASQYAPAYPAQVENVSFGLRDTLLDEGSFDPPTPGGPNGDDFAVLPQPVFSEDRGHFDAPFSLTLSHGEPGVELRYTLDGRDPADGAGQVYTGPLNIDRTRIVRAVATKSGYSNSELATSTFLFPAHVLQQSHASVIADGYPAEWVEADGTDWTNGGVRPGAWYGFDTVVLALYDQAELEEALRALPSISIAMAPLGWFGNASIGEPPGIYCNSELDITRKCSVEWIDGEGEEEEFQIDCGVAIQGSSSVSANLRNQLSFALKFRKEFGPGKLDFPVFGDGVSRFDDLVLDAGNDNAPNSLGQASSDKLHAQGLRDQFISDLQLAMGSHAPRGRAAHVYLNGIYWGVYNIHERANHRAAAVREGGEPEEYDFVKEGVVLEGNSNHWNDPVAPGAWETAVEIAGNGLTETDTWQNQPAYEAFQEWFDVSDYVDYLLVNYYGGNLGWPGDNWLGTSHSRLSADYTDVNPHNPGWRWHSWDAECTVLWNGYELLVGDGFYDRTDRTSTWSGSAVYFYTYLREHPDWRMLFADRAHEHLFHGPLYVHPDFSALNTPYDLAHPDRNRPATTYERLAAELAPAVMLEYARWANYWHTPGALTPQDWQVERERIQDSWCAVRSDVLIAQLRNVQPQLYPDLDAPFMTPHGGVLEAGSPLSMEEPAGATVFFTLDGCDPRLPGGAVSPSAQIYNGPFLPPGPAVVVKARAYDGSEWSALESAGFVVGARVVINEIMSNNAGFILDPQGEADDWIELVNRSKNTVDLEGWGLSDDPQEPARWRFPAGVMIQPGEHLLVWIDDDEGDGPLHASFKLSKNGESVVLTGPPAAEDVPVDQVTYPKQKRDRTFGRLPSAVGPFVRLPDPSPAAPNMPRDNSWQ